MSEVKVNKVSPRSGTTVTIGDSGDTINIVGTLQNNGSALTGDISSVVAGTGLSGGATSGVATLNIEAAQPTITSLGTITGFTSTGIDDNATSTAITIDSSGDVGINNTAPNINSFNKALTLSGTNNAGYELAKGSTLHGALALQGDNRLQLINFQNADITFNTGTSASERMRITSTGLGIGTSSPSYELQVQDTSGSCFIAITSNNTNESTLLLGDSDSASIGRVTYRNSDNSLAFNTNGSEAMRIDSSGHLGLGTSSPGTYNLNIQDGSSSATVLLRGASGQGAYQEFDVNGGTTIGYIGDAANLVSGGSQTDLAIRTTNNIEFSTGLTERMKLLSNGNFGIGTGSPSEKLHVVGDILATGGDFKSDANNYLGFSNDTFARFVINDSEKMRITSSGKVGIGDTALASNAIFSVEGNIGSPLVKWYDKRSTSTVDVFSIYSDHASTQQRHFLIEADGDVFNTFNSYGALSDRKFKENETDANSQWNDIKALQIKNYNLKISPDKQLLGVIAQDLETSGMNGLVKNKPDELYTEDDVLPEGKNIGDIKEEGYKEVKYSILYMKAVKALQEAMERIETLEARITTLENA